MDILLNEKANFFHEFTLEEHKDELEQGYAVPIKTVNNATVLIFSDVEEHRDGNGWAILWLTKGGGQFYLEDQSIELKEGDVVMFDDNMEHGFASEEVCQGVNFLIDRRYELEEIKQTISQFKKTYQCSTHTMNDASVKKKKI